MGKYDDILHLPYPRSRKRQHMSMQDRAAQFSPFAALTGHADAVKEMARQVLEKMKQQDDFLYYVPQKKTYSFSTCVSFASTLPF